VRSSLSNGRVPPANRPILVRGSAGPNIRKFHSFARFGRWRAPHLPTTPRPEVRPGIHAGAIVSAPTQSSVRRHAADVAPSPCRRKRLAQAAVVVVHIREVGDEPHVGGSLQPLRLVATTRSTSWRCRRSTPVCVPLSEARAGLLARPWRQRRRITTRQ
jgi:hypothetical protein